LAIASFVLCCAIVAAPLAAWAQAGDAAEVQAVSNEMNTFYRAAKKPDVGNLVARWERLTASDEPAALPPMVGFLAAYFEKNPAEIDRVAKRTLARKGQSVVLVALEAASNDAGARRLGNKWHWSDKDLSTLADIKPLDQLVPASASDLDTLWGAAFATGDAAYVRKIYEFYAKLADDPKVEFGDIVRVVQARATRKNEGLRGIIERYPPEMANRIVVAASALWSLMTNAGLHPFVKTELDRIEKDASGTNAVKAMVALRQPM
jgi:hypothetical protein